jgi:hypothetical protein
MVRRDDPTMPTHKTLAVFALAAVNLAMSRRAEALNHVGIEGGVSQRTVGWVEPVLTGWALGVYAETDLSPLFRLGPYYLHYELPSNDRFIYFPDEAGHFRSGALNALGLRLRFMLPVPGPFMPYAFAGLGNTWLIYRLSATHKTTGHFVEAPIGIGVALRVIDAVFISLDAAYRPAIAFGGEEFSGDGAQASFGSSFLLAGSFTF